MARRPDTSVQRVEAATYRCPGCGEMVDSRRTNQMLQHHRHVLEQQYPPAWFNVTAHLQRTATNASTSAAQAEPQRAPQTPTAAAAELQRKRYGH